MPEVFVIFVVVAVLAVGAFVFALWAAMWMLRGLGTLLGASLRLIWHVLAGSPELPVATPSTLAARPQHRAGKALHCGNDKCRAALPEGARFCVRCGTSTMAVARRVA